ncbi:hypothetical protein [Nocardioides dilutus]
MDSTRGVKLAAFAQPDIRGNQMSRVLPLAATTADADGDFTLAADFDAIPADYVHNDGGVDMTLLISDSSRTISWYYTLYPAEATQPGLHEVIESRVLPRSGRGPDESLAPMFTVDLDQGTLVEDGNPPSTFVDAKGKPYSARKAARAAKVAVSKRATGMYRYARVFLRASRAERARMLGIGAATARDETLPTDTTEKCGQTYWADAWKRNVRQDYVFAYSEAGIPISLTQGMNGSTTHTMGIALIKGDGTLAGSGTRTRSYSKKSFQSPVINALVGNRVNYRKRIVACGDKTWEQYEMYDYFTDFQQVAHANAGPYCSNKLAGNTWDTETATAATLGGGVKFPTINLSSQTGYGDSQDMKFTFNVAGKICGNNVNGPLHASRVDARNNS